jgi:hypothetical protein
MRQCPRALPFIPLREVFIVLSKILAGVLAVGVLTVGGYAYWQQSSDCCCDTTTDQQQPSSDCPAQSDETPSCCQAPSRASLTKHTDASCCDSLDSVVSAETLDIPPREVK